MLPGAIDDAHSTRRFQRAAIPPYAHTRARLRSQLGSWEDCIVRIIATSAAARPASHFAQAVEVEAGQRLLFISGQVGKDTEGRIPDDEREQHVVTWRNIFAILEAAGMSAENIVDVQAFITGRDGVATFRSVREEMLGGHLTASTLIIVSGLADPALKVEIAVVAAKP